MHERWISLGETVGQHFSLSFSEEVTLLVLQILTESCTGGRATPRLQAGGSTAAKTLSVLMGTSHTAQNSVGRR